MKCSFCGNPPSLCNHLFQAMQAWESDKPITEAHICDNCVRTAYRRLLDISTENNKEVRAKHFKLPNSHINTKKE